MEAFRITSLPPNIYYISQFLDPSICDNIVTSIRAMPDHKWTSLSHRRLLSLPSQLSGKSRDTLLLSSPLPIFLEDSILPQFQALGLFRDSPHGAPNHVLVNEYQPGQGIMPHEDGPAYYPVTATVSLLSSIVLEITSKAETAETRQHWRILQEPGSLLVTSDECYTMTKHGIAEVEVDENLDQETIANWQLLSNRNFVDGKHVRQPRISLTYRDVKKVLSLKGVFQPKT